MKIITLTAENIKKLTAVAITPDGNLVQITGKNGQGKTSVLDAIFWALAGKDGIQKAPIRRGEQEARISLDLGEIKVIRKFKVREDQKITTSIVVENAEGARFQSPQKLLDGLLGSICLDPLEFSRMPARDQFDLLRGFVPDYDFDGAESATKLDYEARTDINRQAKEARTLAGQIQVPADLPADPIDEDALVDELEGIGKANAEIEARRARRQDAARDAGAFEERAAGLHDRAEALRQDAAKIEEEAEVEDAKAADLRGKINESKPLPEPADPADLRARIAAARETNEQIKQRLTKAQCIARAVKLEAESAALTAAMEQREQEKRQAVAGAKLPVEGLDLGDGNILMDGLPFDQASDADQLRASMAMAMATGSKLRVIRVRDGSLLDADSLALIAEMAEAQDYQVWIERVADDGAVGFVIEDGHLKGQEETIAAE